MRDREIDITPHRPRRCPKCNQPVWQGGNGKLIGQGGTEHVCGAK